jgi:hypothetical protein
VIGRWTSNLKSDDEIKRFKSSLEGSRTILERLTQIIEETEASLQSDEFNVRSYDNPSWAYKQAFYNGAKAQLKLIKKLINPDQGDTK